MGEFKQNEVVNLGISPFGFQVPDDEITKYPKPGFQNAPAFCEDTDKALGTYSFNVPTDFATGEYTFVWLWAFNGAQVCTVPGVSEPFINGLNSCSGLLFNML